jgi:hydrogenase-4 component B
MAGSFVTPSAMVGAGLLMLLIGGLAGLIPMRRRILHAVLLGAFGGGCALLAAGGLRRLLGEDAGSLVLSWQVPGGAARFGIDALGAWFCIVIGLLGAPVALYAVSYFRKERDRVFRSFGLGYGVLLASLATLAGARHGLLFLGGWELMTLSAWSLVVMIHEQESVRWAGRLYLVANHSAAFGLLALVGLLGAGAGSLDFDAWESGRGSPPVPGLLLILSLLAFGTKAAIIPLHIWLPHAHPAAPSPVSAVLSGLVVKAGIFGFLRFSAFLPVPTWWGVTLLVAGVVSGILGVLYALAQHELKRLLAYHTVENIGIILLGTGVGLLGVAIREPEIAALGFAGALLHVLNHTLFKGLLFLGAGSVIHATGTGSLDELGGVARTMPRTAACFLVGCVSICGLPPFNGFVSEWTIYRGLFGRSLAQGGGAAFASVGAILALALIGGLAAACFAKVLGVVFLGSRRAAHAGASHEAPAAEQGAMAFLAAICLLLGILPQVAVRLVWPAAREISGRLGLEVRTDPGVAAGWLVPVSVIGGLVIVVAAALALLRSRLARRTPAPAVPTWGCGYSLPGPKLQYTASSFAHPLLSIFRHVLFTRIGRRAAAGSFPEAPAVATHTDDAAETYVFRPLFTAFARVCGAVRFLQRLPVQAQVFVVMLMLAIFLVWRVAL